MRALALTLAILCHAGWASAQATTDVALPPDEVLDASLLEPDTTAESAYELGVRLFQAGRFDGAERAWLRSNELEPNPTLWIAIANTKERRGDEPGTVEMLERYLEARPDAPDAGAVRARIATLLETPAVVTVRSSEPGHAILLDGKPIEQKTPARIELEPGTHTIVVVGDARRVGEQQIQVGYGEERELTFTAATPSTVIVEEDPGLADLEREELTAKRAVWTLSGISAAALVTGTVLGFTAVKQEENFRNDPTTETADKGERLALFADVSFGIAAITAVTALTVFLTTRNKRKRRDKDTARLRFDNRGAGASATFRF